MLLHETDIYTQGVFANATIELGTLFNSSVFSIGSTILALLLVILWLANILATVMGLLSGRVLSLPSGWRSTLIEEDLAQGKGDHPKD